MYSRLWIQLEKRVKVCLLAQWKLSRFILVRDIKAISLNWDENTSVATSQS